MFQIRQSAWIWVCQDRKVGPSIIGFLQRQEQKGAEYLQMPEGM
ncbi:hypothetical protein [Methanosarcina horonobensis]|nr:hypothetical protein [Methanosarcina horonobensis]